MQSGHYFIDRDGRHFHDILNYLRVSTAACYSNKCQQSPRFIAAAAAFSSCAQDGSLNYPPDGADYKYLLELRAEAEYYGLTGLLEQIDRYPVSTSTF